MPLFTKEELEALRLADAELDEEFRERPEEIARSRRMDREAQLDRMDNRERGIAAYQAAYREANRDKIAARRRAKRQAATWSEQADKLPADEKQRLLGTAEGVALATRQQAGRKEYIWDT